VVIGWPIELAGILLVAAPDWWPGVKTMARRCLAAD
jgi:hypothetical protein